MQVELVQTPQIVKDVRDRLRQVLDPTNQYPDFRYLSRSYWDQYTDVRVLGIGKESIVIVHPGNRNFAISFHYNNKLFDFNTDTLYSMHNELKMMFPHNFAELIGIQRGEYPYAILERIFEAPTGQKIRYPFSRVISSVSQQEMPVWFDLADSNFILGTDGGEYYVDTVLHA